MPGIDYSKWDHMGSTSEEESDGETPAPTKKLVQDTGLKSRDFGKLMSLKQTADTLFEQAESEMEGPTRTHLFNDAIAKYKDILQHSKGSDDLSAKISFSIALACSRTYDFKGVVENATSSLGLIPTNHQALQLRGMAHLNLHEPDKAKADWEKAMDLGKGDPQFRSEMNKLIAQLPKEEAEEQPKDAGRKQNAAQKKKAGAQSDTVQTSIDRGARWLGMLIGMLQGFALFIPAALRTRAFMWCVLALLLSVVFGPSDMVKELLGMADATNSSSSSTSASTPS